MAKLTKSSLDLNPPCCTSVSQFIWSRGFSRVLFQVFKAGLGLSAGVRVLNLEYQAMKCCLDAL